MSTLRRYDIRSDRKSHSGWAIIVIDLKDGYFSTVSDYGNYSYCWPHHGMKDFREFFLDIQEDYFVGKITQGRPKVFNCQDSIERIRRAILEARRSKVISRARARMEWDLADDLECGGSEGDFSSWLDETRLDEPWEFAVRSSADSDSYHFFEKVMPCWVALLREELQQENALLGDKQSDQR